MPVISTKIDSQTATRLRQLSHRTGASTAEILRTALFQVLDADATPFQAGWQQGKVAAYAEAMAAIRQALASLDSPRR